MACEFANMRTPSFRIDGKKALVTGASKGIGLAAAHALAQAGAHVVLSARNTAELEQARDAIASVGGSASVCPHDVTDSKAVRDAFVQHEYFDVVVNNAGTNRPSLLSEMEDEDLDAVLELNVKAAFYVS